MFVSYAAYCEAEKKVDAIIDEINYIRKIFVENYIFPLLSSYQRLKGFTPYEINNYINSDKKYFADLSVISNGKNMIYFSIIPDNETDASYLASRVTAYCDELDSITDRLNSIENVSQKYKELLSSKSTSVFEKSSLRVQRMISEKSTILGTSDRVSA